MAKIQKPAQGRIARPKLRGGRAEAAKPRLPANKPFIMLAHRSRWTVMDGQLIPQLRQLTLQGGSNGVTDRLDPKTKEVIYEAEDAISRAVEQGWVPLRPEKVGDYVAEYDVVGGGVHFAHICQKVYPGSNHTEPDAEAYVAWCQKLVEEEHIEEPPLYVLEAMLAQYQKREAQAADKNSNSARRFEKLYADIAKMLQGLIAKAKGEDVESEKAAEGDELARLKAELAAFQEVEAKVKAEAKAAKAAKTRAEKAAAKAEADKAAKGSED
jgi:hypothetical protein